jgi:hypothetical protein
MVERTSVIQGELCDPFRQNHQIQRQIIGRDLSVRIFRGLDCKICVRERPLHRLADQWLSVPMGLGTPRRLTYTVQSPNVSGRSRHGEPVRTIQSTPSTNILLSRPVEPFWPGRPMISGAIRCHAASHKTNRSITPKAASQKAALNLICW